ncbi:hypothetical protein HCN51_27075 [Nonomuraea sp. FMUSA5-5]|uniref:HTH araC/xylS-type domain-containing protein n=1 Tax=Nonomuraea composti TaxID=2720023 RepID=A0ABX1B5G0_9ACTN|nr:hypothetical protein [Nonomuraea sp. FMUSA5-5]NJP93068.1 hypothetical protein [Nonomuraea sp. FMUSA5-5]
MQVVFDSTDPERIAAFLAATYGAPVKMSAGRAGYRFRHTRLGLGPLYVNTIDHTATTEYHADPFPALIVVRAHRGVRTDLDERPGSASRTTWTVPTPHPHHTPWPTCAASGWNAPTSSCARATWGDGTTVTAVAARWGFLHPGHFAAVYQQTYG